MECRVRIGLQLQTAQQMNKQSYCHCALSCFVALVQAPRATRNDSLLVVQGGFYEAYCLQMHG